MNWHYVEQGQQLGPVGDDRLLELERSGTINTDTLVWHEGMTDWKPFRDVRADLKPAGIVPGSSPTATAATPSAGSSGPEAICAECGKIFPMDEMIRHGNVRICSSCKPVFMQKLAEGAKINTGEMKFASVPTRFAAVFIDGILLFVVNMAISMIAGLSIAQAAGVQPKGALMLQLVLFAINLSIGISYEVFLIGKYGATLGKMACKIRVVTADGGRVSYLRALGRYFGKMLSSITLMIGYIIAIFDGEKRALHDHICGTRVILK